MEQFLFETPRSVKELIVYLKNADVNTYILSGGTDLTIKLRNRGIYSGRIIDMSGISELEHIKIDDGFIKIGANVTFAEIGESEIINKYAACVGQAARQVGSQQIRNAASMAGNIANSSPRGDSIPALLAVNALIRTINSNGKTTLRTIDEIVIGISKNSLKKDEAIIEMLIPYVNGGCRSAFSKYGRESSRTTVVIANINVAAAVKYDSSTGVIEDASIVIGSAAPIPYHAVMAENALRGSKPTVELGYRFVSALQDHVKDSINGVKRYENKIDEVTGAGIDIYNMLFGDMLTGGER
ncbi:MAG TPA: FAD binding domain-containing protein [Clostridia bacterium]|nr:FAD binding domain-containing protein [Clostridia bacterium]